MNPLTRAQIADAFRTLGLRAGMTVMVHSSLSSIGPVADGAETVVDAFLDVLGPQGTLTVPTFTFSHGQVSDPIFDPLHDPSEMGQISEAARLRPGARRSIHLLHSVAAVGPNAEAITAVHGPSAWAADGPFWQLYLLGAHILLLGVPYLRCTYFHIVEQYVSVRYRRWTEIEARVRRPDGRIEPLPTLKYHPKPGFVGNDFNKFGAMLEAQGRVRVGAVGNAVARLFPARDVFDLGIPEYRKDPDLFVKTGDGFTPLRDGVLTGPLHNEKAVWNPAATYRK